MAAAAGGDGRAGIGTRLRAAREKKGLTVLQAAEKMHLDSRILEALETEDFASLGAAVYAKGHLRHYAELLGEQPAELVELYSGSARAAPVQPDLTRISRALPENDPGKLGGPAVIALVTIAIVGTLWWVISSSGGEKPQPAVVQETQQSGSVAKSNTPTQQSAEPADHAMAGADTQRSSAAAGTAAAAVGKAASGAAQVSQVATATTVASSLPGAPKPISRPALAGAAAAVATVARATPTSALAAPGVAPLARPNPTPRAKDSELTLKFSSDSWAEVYDAAGQRLFYDVGAASSAHTVKGPAPMRVVLGNASGVTLEYNGRPAQIPSGVLPDGSVRFVITARGRTAPATDGD